MGGYIVTFDKSNEDIPCLCVARKTWLSIGESVEIVNIITGDRAVELWHELTEKAKKEVKNNGIS